VPAAEPKSEEHYRLPYVDDATLVEMSGARALGQYELWENLGQANVGKLSAWVLIEAERLARQGVSPRDAAVYMAGFVVTAFTRQQERDAAAAELRKLFDSSKVNMPKAAPSGDE
jgi:hypothetical protein